MSPAVEVWSINQWTTREVPIIHFYSYIHSSNIYWAPTICQVLSLGSRNIARDKTDENPAPVELEDQQTKLINWIVIRKVNCSGGKTKQKMVEANVGAEGGKEC